MNKEAREIVEKTKMVEAMHLLVKALNDEDAYDCWCNIVPDGADTNDLVDIAEDEDLFRETCEAFRSIMADYGEDKFCIGTKTY